MSVFVSVYAYTNAKAPMGWEPVSIVNHTRTCKYKPSKIETVKANLTQIVQKYSQNINAYMQLLLIGCTKPADK